VSDAGGLTAAHVPLGSSMYERDRLDGIARRAEDELRDAGITLVRTDPVTHPDDVERAVALVHGGAERHVGCGQPAWVGHQSATEPSGWK